MKTLLNFLIFLKKILDSTWVSMSALGFFNGVIRSNVALAFVLLNDTVLKLVLIWVLMVCSRALVIVDHLHFQYNGVFVELVAAVNVYFMGEGF